MGSTTIEPGGESNFVFSLPMGMHQGMEGKHRFRVTIPVRSGGAGGDLYLYVTGDFR